MATESHLMQIDYLMATMNIGHGGNNSLFIKVRNSITAPLLTSIQAQSSASCGITFCIICGSHCCVNEDSSLLLYCTELIGEEKLMCQGSMLPTSKSKSVSVHVMKVYQEYEVHFQSFRNSLQEGVG
jgi:hypothetical protein